jgi:hypothetical protein
MGTLDALITLSILTLVTFICTWYFLMREETQEWLDMLCYLEIPTSRVGYFVGALFLEAAFLVAGHIHANMALLRMFLGEGYERQFHQILDADFWRVVHWFKDVLMIMCGKKV